MRVRAATPGDAPALAALEAVLFGLDAWSEAPVLEEIVGPGRRALVAVEGEEVLGYVVTRSTGEVADLQRIAVRPDQQRRGLAHRLLGEALALAREDGVERVLLEVSTTNSGALRFYAAEGFEVVDRRRRYYRDGSDAVVMGRSPQQATAAGRG
ncbi:MAG TPA: ribosomal protein S18-alanine N-acetyltransferase [Nocardioidaceae bacterium]